MGTGSGGPFSTRMYTPYVAASLCILDYSLCSHEFIVAWTSKAPNILAPDPKIKGMWAISLGTLVVELGDG